MRPNITPNLQYQVARATVLYILYSNPLPDEAYYWLWSNRVALSYFDHPPLLAWVQAFLLSYYDSNYFAIRTLPIVSLGIVMAIMMVWQKHVFNRFCYDLCLKSMVLFLASDDAAMCTANNYMVEAGSI